MKLIHRIKYYILFDRYTHLSEKQRQANRDGDSQRVITLQNKKAPIELELFRLRQAGL